MENGEKVREKFFLFIFVFNWSDFKLVGLKCFLTFFSTGLTKMFFPQIENKIREKKWNKGVDQCGGPFMIFGLDYLLPYCGASVQD